MKIILQDNRRYVLRFDKGDEVVSGIFKFMQEQQITACTFSGIGSALEVEFGYYNQHLKQYRKKPYVEEMEVVSLIGNGSIMEGKPAVHMHGIIGRLDFTLLGGHIFKLVTLATCEIFLIKLEGNLERKNNPEWNLNLLI
ncbi:MAG: hypothetical protein COT92_00635 [Candidatus Doudnabacteria bacterium CG10_big_fil_rev_8_21_14_0_10_42_18]|uniref:PPC domain-containing protein n=1 Tax=Candidatus Doudnabacteria bacterium CG10_big_fil_rev_8_21_14_0_10_42_18 TaxID=1974552 RepID=A0A2H0VBP2_9BACT|nr:MAG: hypothetical protein COT92_00635 [Candidatus Doudnabacteria bacterium CG10_big_fil_rev_8_21_14_0_10_42_18]